ncbi:MAG TPA: phosphotransferase family protein [Acidimicrobiales bacterium]|nr:phosphotransferase family protein [Acidimicrobiales bacterium]
MEERETEALRRWIVDHVDGIDDAPIETELISGGHSNVTIGARVGGRELVVRRPPVTAFLPTANDVGREYRFYSALRDTPVPTPAAFAFCDDDSVIGAPFYVMERLHGVVPHEVAALDGITAADASALCDRFVEVLAAIHAVDYGAVGLADIGKPTGYLERQVRRWTDQWHRAKVDDDPVIDELASVLGANIPPSPAATIVHGDYRLGNVMLDASTRRDIVGVFDWEMATLGDPLADVGYTMLYWGTTDRPPIHPSQECAEMPGMYRADELAQRYAEVSGRAVDHVEFYIVLAAFKLSIIGAGNAARARRAGLEAPVVSGQIPLANWALEFWNRP